MNKVIGLIILSLFVLSCGRKSSDYVHHYNPPRKPTFDVKKPLKNLNVEGNIDILWVIDNSGSMQTIQNNVIANSKIFMEQFVRQKYINWKMGVISTDKRDRPRIGFDNQFESSMVDHNDPNSFDQIVRMFQDAVRGLGINGDASEYTFYNILRMIQEYNGAGSVKTPFLRPNSHLAVIMVTDEEEQSEDFGAQYQALSFLNTLGAFVNSNRTIRFYGAFDFGDLQDCRNSWEDYAGSAFEEIISETGGFHISACVSDFGSKLVEVGKDIASLISLPSLLLEERPKAHTIRVWYEKLELKSGRPEDGGYWFYDEYNNTINFYSLDFVDDVEDASFRVEFDIDDGIRRPGDPDDSKTRVQQSSLSTLMQSRP